MKGTYRCYVRREFGADWELVGSAKTADEGHAMALHWERSGAVATRLDVCVRMHEVLP